MLETGVLPGGDQCYPRFELILQTLNLQANGLSFHTVGHVDGQYYRNAQVLDLGEEQEVAFEVLHFCHYHSHIGKVLVVAVQQQLDHHILIDGGSVEAIGSGQVEHMGLEVAIDSAGAFFLLDCDAGIITYLLVEPCKPIKDRGLADVGVTNKRYVDLSGHGYSMRSTRMCRAISLRMARWVPLMSRYKGSLKGAVWTRRTSFPGRQPISSSFKGTESMGTSIMVARWPRSRDARLGMNLFRLIINSANVVEFWPPHKLLSLFLLQDLNVL